MSKRVAVVGAGVAGVVSAYLLSREFEVELFEAGSYLGGHTNTVELEDPRAGKIAVDTGFIVLNDKTYPNFTKFLAQLDCPIRYSNMSFGYSDESQGFAYAGNGLNGLFADRSNLFRPSFYSFLSEILRFSKQAWSDLEAGMSAEQSLGDYLKVHGYSEKLIDCYLVPVAAAIWSAPFSQIMDFPALTLLRFFRNHGLLALKDRPRWQTVVGGSYQYMRKFADSFTGKIYLGAAVAKIEGEKQNRIRFASGEVRDFDHVVLATHADSALRLIESPTALQTELLSKWEYAKNRTVLHWDDSVMPQNKRAWASWTFLKPKGFQRQSPLFVSYYMNLLQGLNTARDYLVTLNSPLPLDESKVIAAFDYEHPVFSAASVATQSELPKLNTEGELFFVGSYFRYGFHEDAVSSAVQLAKDRFRIEL